MNRAAKAPVRMIALLIAVLAAACQEPPADKLQIAKQSLTGAASAGAQVHAAAKYRDAERWLREASLETARQKGRFAPFRDYARADSLLALATETAAQARSESEERIRDYEAMILSERGRLRQDIREWRGTIAGTLLRNQVERFLNQAELADMTSVKLHRSHEYQAALSAIDEGKDALRRLAEAFSRYNDDAAGKIHIWRRWVTETVDESRRRRVYAVIVDKSRHKTFVIKDGNLLYEYDCELGYNPARQKLFAGDGATPEGKYRVSVVKHNGSKYYKALLLDYPNQADKARFAENKAKGIISGSARIGGWIEIHGDKGRGSDWTEGCVALANEDMDQILACVGVGTPVTIVRRSDVWP